MTTEPSGDLLRVDDWDNGMGAKWLAHIDMFETLLEPPGRASG